ncbi:hypothetical protein ACI68E_001853 [Malassezia pachydermatis]|uniref:Uncharacterized protein n=1 Tax=Malassezia pachydermatis TaxID=77020 RepID=A0A0M9VR48_9BASI|nr:hypothetical protein Malapachy_2944 [Malassezia pachydermatis]KOS16239.1 hypothetical protein Malapachy_2944 [Malassezia pachydermatis]
MAAEPHRSRWAPITGRGRRRASQSRTSKKAPTLSKRHEQILANDTLETQVQNEMSPFPPASWDHVSRRSVPESVQARYVAEYRLPTLRDVCLKRAAQYFSTHILPTPDVLDTLRLVEEGGKAPPKKRVRVQRQKDDYIPDEDEGDGDARDAGRAIMEEPRSYQEALWWYEANGMHLKCLPSALIDELYDLLCEYAPRSLTKEVIQAYFMPYPTTSTQRARVRRRLFFPASLPLFSQDTKCASLLLASLTGTLALSDDAALLASGLRELRFPGLTRLSPMSLIRLFKAPKQPSAWRLTQVCLPGCLSMNDTVVQTLVAVSGATLEHVDLTMTSVSPESLMALGMHCPVLSVLKLAWCEGFTDDSVAAMVSECVAQCTQATPPSIPFQRLTTLDVSHTLMGDVAVGGLCRMSGRHVRSLDVNYTRVGESGALDVLSMGLGLGPLSQLCHTTSQICHLGLAGLCVSGISLVHFLHKWLPYPYEDDRTPSQLRSLNLDDMVEYARRHQTSLQGRRGLSGDTMYMLASMIEAQSQGHAPMACVRMNGEKRSAWVSSHWVLPRDQVMIPTSYTLGDAMYKLMAHTNTLHLGGLDMPVSHLDPSMPAPPLPERTQRCLAELHLPSTGLRDDAAHYIASWTGALTSLYLDDTLVTCEGVDAWIDANPRLALLSLSQCRGLPVRRRRGYFA